MQIRATHLSIAGGSWDGGGGGGSLGLEYADPCQLLPLGRGARPPGTMRSRSSKHADTDCIDVERLEIRIIVAERDPAGHEGGRRGRYLTSCRGRRPPR